MKFQDLATSAHTFPGLTDDSREVLPEWIFVAGGERAHAVNHARQTLARGACFVVGEPEIVGELPKSIVVQDWRDAAAALACAFYRNLSRDIQLIGVTGTCGKTTTTALIEAVLSAAGRRVGVIGTASIRYGGLVFESPNTTPSSIVLNRTLRHMVDSGIDSVVMEASSHGIHQKRIRGLLFDGAVFTNLSLEHQDIHHSLAEYFYAKSLLFSEYATSSIAAGKSFSACVNVDDCWGEAFYASCEQTASAWCDRYALSSFTIPFEGDRNGAVTLKTHG
ncbi:UDP-N-acetylmuramoylalanyl-D-glutamate-2,6- diaminopimelate ligase [Candidatus Burkholderia humilis]|nr:UDP-N-acetylmuramoylalanyl-D-glutamate-2,6- diaminopimelate ligase [Candidatus Burkholderia humilis]